MPSLREFIDQCPADEVVRVTEGVEADYFTTALARELAARKKYPLLYVEKPGDFDIPVVANLFADPGRIARALGLTREEFLTTSWFREPEENPIPPRMVNEAPVHEVVSTGSDIDVTKLPISRHHEQDAGRYITSGILVARDPETKVRNLSYARLQLKGPDKFGISLHSRGHAWSYMQRSEAQGKDLEVAVIIGAHPALYVAAAAKVGIEVDEYDLAGALLGEPVDLVESRTVGVEVPAEAEIVLEGRILAGVHEDEGPFGEYTGYATGNSTFNVLELSAICRRREPLYLDLIPSTVEHRMLGSSSKKSHVFQRLQEVVPTVKALNYPQSGTYFNVYVSMKKMAEGQGRHALMLLFGLDPYIKHAIVVDEDIDVYDEEQVLWAVATRVQADTDVFIVPKVICNKLDPSAIDGMSAKMGIDATAPLDWGVEAVSAPADSMKAAIEYLDRP